jgi:hypothetical protein
MQAWICQQFNELKRTLDPQTVLILSEYFDQINYPQPQHQLMYSMLWELFNLF